MLSLSRLRRAAATTTTGSAGGPATFRTTAGQIDSVFRNINAKVFLRYQPPQQQQQQPHVDNNSDGKSHSNASSSSSSEIATATTKASSTTVIPSPTRFDHLIINLTDFIDKSGRPTRHLISNERDEECARVVLRNLSSYILGTHISNRDRKTFNYNQQQKQQKQQPSPSSSSSGLNQRLTSLVNNNTSNNNNMNNAAAAAAAAAVASVAATPHGLRARQSLSLLADGSAPLWVAQQMRLHPIRRYDQVFFRSCASTAVYQVEREVVAEILADHAAAAAAYHVVASSNNNNNDNNNSSSTSENSNGSSVESKIVPAPCELIYSGPATAGLAEAKIASLLLDLSTRQNAGHNNNNNNNNNNNTNINAENDNSVCLVGSEGSLVLNALAAAPFFASLNDNSNNTQKGNGGMTLVSHSFQGDVRVTTVRDILEWLTIDDLFTETPHNTNNTNDNNNNSNDKKSWLARRRVQEGVRADIILLLLLVNGFPSTGLVPRAGLNLGALLDVYMRELRERALPSGVFSHQRTEEDNNQNSDGNSGNKSESLFLLDSILLKEIPNPRAIPGDSRTPPTLISLKVDAFLHLVTSSVASPMMMIAAAAAAEADWDEGGGGGGSRAAAGVAPVNTTTSNSAATGAVRARALSSHPALRSAPAENYVEALLQTVQMFVTGRCANNFFLPGFPEFSAGDVAEASPSSVVRKSASASSSNSSNSKTNVSAKFSVDTLVGHLKTYIQTSDSTSHATSASAVGPLRVPSAFFPSDHNDRSGGNSNNNKTESKEDVDYERSNGGADALTPLESLLLSPLTKEELQEITAQYTHGHLPPLTADDASSEDNTSDSNNNNNNKRQNHRRMPSITEIADCKDTLKALAMTRQLLSGLYAHTLDDTNADNNNDGAVKKISNACDNQYFVHPAARHSPTHYFLKKTNSNENNNNNNQSESFPNGFEYHSILLGEQYRQQRRQQQ